MTTINHPEKLKDNGPHDLGQINLKAKAKAQIVGVIETTPEQQAVLEAAAEQITKAGYWGKVIAGRIRVIMTWKGPSSSASETLWFRTAKEALEHFQINLKETAENHNEMKYALITEEGTTYEETIAETPTLERARQFGHYFKRMTGNHEIGIYRIMGKTLIEYI